MSQAHSRSLKAALGMGAVLLLILVGWWVAGMLVKGPGPEKGAAGTVAGGETVTSAPAPTVPPPLEIDRPETTYKSGEKTPAIAAIAPDGKTFLATQRTIQQGVLDSLSICDATTGAVVKTLQEPNPNSAFQVSTATLSPDGKFALTGNFTGNVRLWDVDNARQLTEWREGHLIDTLAISPDGKYAASGGSGQGRPAIQLYDLASRQKSGTLTGHGGMGFGTDGITRLLFTPDSKSLVSAGSDGTVRTWDIAAKTPLLTLPAHTQTVTSLAVAADGSRIASGGADGRWCVWDAKDGKLIRRMRIPETDRENRTIGQVCFLPDGKSLLVGMQSGAQLIDIETGQSLAKFHAWETNLYLFPDGQTFSSGYRIWRIPQGLAPVQGAVLPSDPAPLESERVLKPEMAARENYPAPIAAMAVLPDHQVIGAYTPVGGAQWTTWDWTTGTVVKTVKAENASGKGVAAISRDGTLVVTREYNAPMTLFDASTGKSLRNLASPARRNFDHVALSPDGRCLAASTRTQDDKSEIHLFDTATGNYLRPCEGPADPVAAIAFSPDGARLFTGGGRLQPPPGKPMEQSNCAVHVWDVATGKIVHDMEGHTSIVQAIDLTADGHFAITGAMRGLPLVWDLTTFQQAGEFPPATIANVAAVRLSSDRKMALLAGVEIRCYDLQASREICRFELHKGLVRSVEFIAEGKRVISASDDGTIRVWKLP